MFVLLGPFALAAALATPAALGGPSNGSLVTNGDFGAGNSGFTSQYTQSASLGPPQTYAVGTNPNTFNGLWPRLGDHTSGTGQMMIVNGSTTANVTVWSERVPVQPDTTYVFSVWAASLYASPAILRFTVNGTTIGTKPARSSVGTWGQLSFSWQSGSATTAVLALIDDNLAFGGNDFALDDIAFTGPAGAGGAGAGSGRVSTIASSITSPSNAFSSSRRTLENVALAALAILLITFPSQLFNHTLDENRAEIVAWWARRFGFISRLRRRRKQGTRRLWQDTTAAAAVVLVGGLLGGLLDPRFGLKGASALTYASVVGSTCLGIAVAGLVAYEYRKRRKRSTTFHFHALPEGLLVGIACVVVSRAASFEPGYLYGIVCSVAFRGRLERREEGQTVALSVLATVSVALLAWIAWVPLNRVATHPHEAWPVVFGDDLVGAVFTGGIVGATIGCFPLRFLPGGTIAKWHRGAWALVFGVVTFVFLEVMLNPGRGGHTGHAPLVTVIVLFVVFGGGSVAFYSHFARKRRARGGAASEHSSQAPQPDR
jgi:hypothetical protein